MIHSEERGVEMGWYITIGKGIWKTSSEIDCGRKDLREREKERGDYTTMINKETTIQRKR